ncbi:esterase [Lentibacillus kapialis]|uniref:Esterase n=1 Tax=Lentibacillus kapialis TaxID=340214 RepID=A0A917PXA4_9BACI|nr:alpha/beta hydrolase [Lentibacillus kapialis]GGJ96592.1 esterase [Lentibacillus kapialis]
MKTTFTYKQVKGCCIKGDFYPSQEKNAPLIVYIHGGGLIWGTRKDMREEQINLYHQAGFNVCSIDYRLAPETKLPEITEDIRDVLHWLQEEGSKTYDFDASKMAVTGSSAGGYLALLSGTLTIRPKAIVSFYGYGNIIGDWYTKPSPHFLKMTKVPEHLVKQLIQSHTIAEAPIERRYAIYLYCRQQGKWIDYITSLNPRLNVAKLKAYCPVENIDADFPPTLLLHGNADKDVPFQESADMYQSLSNAGITTQLITIPNGEHSFDENMENPTVTKAFEQVISFLKSNL